MTYQTKGTCSRQINFDIEENDGKKIVRNVVFIGGCNGNTKGIAQLVDGMGIDEVIDKLFGTDCGGKGTSCPDQLARALQQYR